MSFNESHVEEAALDVLGALGYQVAHGPDLAPGEPGSERATYAVAVLEGRLRDALQRFNSQLPPEAIERVVADVLQVPYASADLLDNNRRFESWLRDGVPVSFVVDGQTRHDRAVLVNWAAPLANDLLALNQLTIKDGRRHRRTDVVVYVNGLPLGLIELKNAGDAAATLEGAWRQLQTYQSELPALLAFNAVLVVSDGLAARAGTLTSPWERFAPWRTVDGDALAAPDALEMEVLLQGIFAPARFLDLVRSFIVWEDEKRGWQKKLAGYHQFHAVNKAVRSTLQAAQSGGDHKAGVVWHTQGSGKSLSMLFYAAKLSRADSGDFHNPTLIVLTDRQDLDGQLFDTFSRCQSLLGQEPKQAQSRDELRALLETTASGGVIFTTIQKFLPPVRGARFPTLSARSNLVVIADEAHRSQYNYAATLQENAQTGEANFSYGFAQHLRDAVPNASFIGFTGTPIEAADRSTPQVFGEYIDIYDIQQAVDDGATVPIFYEARLAKLALDEDERPTIDAEFEEVTEGEEEQSRNRLMGKWARLEALAGSPRRLQVLAADLVGHFEERREAMGELAPLDASSGEREAQRGKAMIVAMSRRICVELYNEIIKLRPEWHSDDDDAGVIKVVMTGNATDPAEFQAHIRSKKGRDELAEHFKDPEHSIKLVIVRDMWLTGFDAPCLHTLYADKPMQGHGLMQAIARVNRVWKEKPGGLVVDYLGLADQLKRALKDYTESDRRQTAIPQDEAVMQMQTQLGIARDILFPFDFSNFASVTPIERLRLMAGAMNSLLPDKAKRFRDAVSALQKVWALAAPHPEALAVREEVGFFAAISASLAKIAGDANSTANVGDSSQNAQGKPQPGDVEAAVRQIVSRSVVPAGIVDIFAAAGLQAPNISILSDQFLEEVRELPQKNLAVELLKRLLKDEIHARGKVNVTEAKRFSQQLEAGITRYQNRSIEAAAIIQELVEMARELREANARGEKLGLGEDELAFYDALEVNDSAQVMGDETLKAIARALVETVKRNVSIDWQAKETARARLRVIVKRLLRQYKYPPDQQETATNAILDQVAQLSANELESV